LFDNPPSLSEGFEELEEAAEAGGVGTLRGEGPGEGAEPGSCSFKGDLGGRLGGIMADIQDCRSDDREQESRLIFLGLKPLTDSLRMPSKVSV